MSDFASTLRTSFQTGRTDAFVAAGVIAVVLALIIPMPTLLVDVLLVVNLLRRLSVNVARLLRIIKDRLSLLS